MAFSDDIVFATNLDSSITYTILTEGDYWLDVSNYDGVGPTAMRTGDYTLSVTSHNTAPVITSNGGSATASINVSENATAVTTVTATDAQSNPITYSILGGTDAARFSINSTTGALTFVSAPNFEAPTDSDGNNTYVVTVNASDASLSDSQTITVTVTNVNEAPVITSNGGGDTASVSVAENGTAVTTVAASDVDAAPTITYAIAGGADAAKFAIDAVTGALSFVAAPNFEAPTDGGTNNVYDVIVSASDGTLTDTQAIAVTVTNVNEAPVITSNGGGDTASVSVAENGTAVTTVAASDVDAATTITYAIAGGADAAKFAIDAATGALSFVAAPNFEAPTDGGTNNVYDVIVSASDGTLTDTQAIAVTVTNVNEAPVITSNGGGDTASVSVAENGTAVTTVAASDVDAAPTITYAIAGGADAAKFAIDAATGALSFVAAPNFEAPTDGGTNNVYDVIVSASDGTLTDTQAIAVTVTNVNEAPVTVNESGTYTENTVIVKDVVANDTDVDNLNSELTIGLANVRGSANLSNGLSLSGDGRTLTFDQNAYQHMVGAQLVTGFDYLKTGETATVYIDYNVKDPDGANSNSVTNPPYGTFEVTIQGANDAPTATNFNAPETYVEDTPLNLTDIVVSDVDSANVTVTLTLSNTAAGSLSTGTSGAAVSSFAAGVWTASGAIADVNALLAGVMFSPALNFNGNLTIATSVSDGEALVTGSKAMAGVAVDDPGVAREDFFVVGQEIFVGNVFADNGSGADFDIDSPLVVSAMQGQASWVGYDITLNSGSHVRLNANGTMTFTPGGAALLLSGPSSIATNTSLTDTFTYTLAGGGTATVTLLIQGRDGAGTLIGTPGPDNLVGGEFDDVLIGRLGADHLDGRGGNDTASYAGDPGGVFVNLSTGRGYANSSFGDTYTSIENVIGTDYNDFIIGDTGTNRLEGGAGNDTIIGGLGPDVLIGGPGIDTLSFEDNSGTVFVNLKTGMGYNNAAQGDTFSGFENVVGGLFDDTIIGDDGANRLDGAMGADTLVGNDGADTFVFSYAPGATSPYGSANVDTLFDFVSGEDKLEISASAFGGGLSAGSLAAGAFVVGIAAGDADDRFVYDQANGRLYFDADGNGAGAQVLMAILPNHDAIAASDFAIV